MVNENLAPGDIMPADLQSKQKSRVFNPDMRPGAILERLQTMSDLSRACQMLGRAERLGKSTEIDLASSAPPSDPKTAHSKSELADLANPPARVPGV